MGKKKEFVYENILLGKLVHGGQCLAELPTGKKVFVWGGLPGETVDIRITKKRKSYSEGIVNTVHKASSERVEPEEPLSYLSTSPWQIINYESELKFKDEILREAFEREGIKDIQWNDFKSSDNTSHYRNKMEFGFWGNEDGLNLAHYVRGSKNKQIVEGSILAVDTINESARALRDELNRIGIWGGKLKTIVLRASQDGKIVSALFIKEDMDFSEFKLPKKVKGMDVYYSDPKSPASVATKKLYSYGDIKLLDTIAGNNITYDVMSFFQVNIPIFELALKDIKESLNNEDVIDFYSGVGTIGVCVGANKLIESDQSNVEMAKLNIADKDIKLVHATAETALESIEEDSVVIIDPPRAGLHKKFVEELLGTKPAQIVYLSCNPSTQARDVKYLSEHYNISKAVGYNFFPRTPHIESLLVLDRR